VKELLAGFTTELFRPIVTLLLPGFWALTPFVIGLFLRYPLFWGFAISHSTACSIVFLVASTAVGMVLENFGGEMENLFFRKHGAKAFEEWYEYLSLTVECRPVGFSYIRTYVLRVKFEGGMFAASCVVTLGVLYLPFSLCERALLAATSVAICTYFLLQVRTSVRELVNTRSEILSRLRASSVALEGSPLLEK
jgi:hypothetical protein